MKKLLLLLVMLLTLGSFTSCLLPVPPTVDPDGNENDPSENHEQHYDTLISNENQTEMIAIRDKIFLSSGFPLGIGDDNTEQSAKEIVFGESNRAVTQKAKDAFDEATEYEVGDCIGYIIYKSEVGAISVYWNHKDMKPLVMELFTENYCDDAVLAALKPGAAVVEFIDLDKYLYDKAWAVVEAQDVPADTLKALKALYAYFDGSAIVDWAAELWDPYICVCGECAEQGKEIACYGGGFYYANSARDYGGFLPDLESCTQLPGMLNNMGAFEGYGSIAEAMPAEVGERLVAFAQACLDKNSGYFYHPQWGSDIGTARRGRDLNHGISILNWYKVKPKYPTFIDRQNGASSATYMTAPLGSSVAYAVSMVKPMALNFEDYNETLEDYMLWLYDVTKTEVDEDGNIIAYTGLKKNSSGAHTISSASSQIQALGYLEATLDFFDEAQDAIFEEALALYEADPENNPAPTGLWQVTADYPMVWGLLKLGDLYNKGNRRIRYEEYAMRACVEAILIDPMSDGGYGAGKEYHMNDVYNCWTAPNRIITSAQKYNPDILPTLYEIAREHAPEMIEKSIGRLKRFKQDDGSFGYCFAGSSPATQGVPVSKGFAEGDVNATTLAIGMYGAVFGVLGYQKVKLCDYRDGDRFRQTVMEMVTPNKIVETIEPDEMDSVPSGVTSDLKNGSYYDIATDPEDPDNSVLAFYTTSASMDDLNANKGAGSQLKFKTKGDVKNATCRVMQFDIYIESISEAKDFDHMYQIIMDKLFMLVLYENDADGSIRLAANPTTSSTKYTEVFDAELERGRWHNIRVEHYYDEEDTRIKIFLDEELVAESERYYGWEKENATPGTGYAFVNFIATKRTDSTIYLDNLLFTGYDDLEYTDSDEPNYPEE